MAGRSLNCATCGAKAPTIAADQRSFVCAYCRTQTFVDPPAPPSDPVPTDDAEDARPFRPKRPHWLGFAPVAIILVVVVVIVARAKRSPASELSDCESFTGTTSRATWNGCPSKATLQIDCHSTFSLGPGFPQGAGPPGLDSLTCDCLRDGESTWFFQAKTPPPLESRDSAERVAAASCKMW